MVEANPVDAFHLVHELEQGGEIGGRRQIASVGIDGLPEERDLAHSGGRELPDLREDGGGAWLRSRPRVTGTTQKVQNFSQPSITVTKALS